MITSRATKILDEWFGKKYPYRVLKYWCNTTDDLHYIVCIYGENIYFIRLFSIGDKLVLSQDGLMQLDEIASCRCAER